MFICQYCSARMGSRSHPAGQNKHQEKFYPHRQKRGLDKGDASQPAKSVCSHHPVEPYRDRKLLLSRKEINHCTKAIRQKGFTMMPLEVFCRGKKLMIRGKLTKNATGKWTNIGFLRNAGFKVTRRRGGRNYVWQGYMPHYLPTPAPKQQRRRNEWEKASLHKQLLCQPIHALSQAHCY